MEKQKARSNAAVLAQLIIENPDLPVIPWVDSDVVAGDCRFWMGNLGEACVDQYVFIDISGETRTVCYGDIDVVMEQIQEDAEEWLIDEELRRVAEDMPWKKAIFVDIVTPETL